MFESGSFRGFAILSGGFMRISSLLARMFEQIPDLLVVINRDLRIEMCNWRGGYDYVPEHLRRKGAHCYELFYPGQGHPCKNCHVLEVFRSGQALVREKYNPRIGHVEVRCFPLFDRQGKVFLVAEQVCNIDERKKMQEALARQYNYLRTLADVVPVPMFSKDEVGRYLGCNKAFEQYIGCTRQEIVGKSVYDQAPKEVADIYHAKDQELFGQGGIQCYESILVLNDGRTREVIFHKATFNKPDGSLGGLVGAILDITERKEAVARLQESEERYRQFFEDDLTGDFIAKVDGRLLACNPSFARIFGFASVEEALRLDLRSIHSDPGSRELLLGRLRQERKIDRVALEARTPAGRTLQLILNAVGIFDDQDELIEVRGYLLDDTERQSLADQLLHSQKMEAVGRLAAGLAHDFNNLLTAIIGYSDALQNALVDPQQVRCAEQIHLAGERAAVLTDQLLALSRRQRLHPAELDLGGVVAGLKDMLQKLLGADIELVVLSDPAVAPVMADVARLEQVILNLAVNARDAMPEGGRLTISTSGLYLDDEQVRSFLDAQPGQYVVLEMVDEGQGISEEVLPHVFEPFFTTKPKGKGTGLGLATAYGIVAQTGGFMSVESRLGAGTTFKVFLPSVVPGSC
jgi:PAS domain S-box-containing protein